MKLNTFEKITAILFTILSIWWFILFFYFDGALVAQNLKWAATYQIVAVWGGVFGLISARAWGGIKSIMGRSVTFFALGLLFQVFGQSAFSYYNLILGVEIPYPSIADIGFFGSVIFYLLGIVYLLKISTPQLRSSKIRSFFKLLPLPLIALVGSYAIFFKGYEYDWSQPLRVFLDFGYPMGEAVYVSVAILIVLLSKNVLGGIMRVPILYFASALIVQYLAEFNFLYQTIYGSWVNGGYGDYIYLLAYFLMAVSLVKTDKAIQYHKVSTE